MTALNTRKQLHVSEIRKMLMLGVFKSTRQFEYLHAKYKEARCQEKIHSQGQACVLLKPTGMKSTEDFSTQLQNTSFYQNGLTSCRKKKAQEQVCCPWVLLAFTFSVKPNFTFTKQPDSWLQYSSSLNRKSSLVG